MKPSLAGQIKAAAATVILPVLLFTACTLNHGRLNRDPAVTDAFLENRFSADYQFYYIGREGLPYAIIGIRDGYRFRSRFWTPVDSSAEKFQKMVKHPHGYQNYRPYGAHILDANGNRVGIWYSSYDFTSIRVTENREVYISNPYSPTGYTDPTKP